MKPLTKLLHRGQFLLGPPSFSTTFSWPTQEIKEGLILSVYPDLPLSHIQDENNSLTLVGFMLDPVNPENSNDDILKHLFTKLLQSKGHEDFPPLTDRFSGRWLIIVRSFSDVTLVHDAAGQRQVHYAYYNGSIYCASQPHLIANHLELKTDPKAELMREKARKIMGNSSGHQFWWPGDRTAFYQIRRLLPNHQLNLKTGITTRFFGKEAIQSRPLEEVIDLAAEILCGAYLCIKNRYHLSLSIGCTSGLDSRVLMAVSQCDPEHVYYFTRRRFAWTMKHPEIAVPRRLLRRNGLKHHIINMPPTMSNEFSDVYMKNFDTPHEHWGFMAEGMFRGLPVDNPIVLTGTVSEVARRFYWKSNDVHDVTPKLLAKKTSLTDSAFTLESFEEWLSKARFGHGINILDMFYWEQRAGSWAASWNDENAIAFETIPLFNCRDLLKTLLSTDAIFRTSPNYELYHKLILKLWPEGLSEPINPPREIQYSNNKGIDFIKSTIRWLLPKPLFSNLKKILLYFKRRWRKV